MNAKVHRKGWLFTSRRSLSVGLSDKDLDEKFKMIMERNKSFGHVFFATSGSRGHIMGPINSRLILWELHFVTE